MCLSIYHRLASVYGPAHLASVQVGAEKDVEIARLKAERTWASEHFALLGHLAGSSYIKVKGKRASLSKVVQNECASALAILGQSEEKDK